jgi:hypothetical protein
MSSNRAKRVKFTMDMAASTHDSAIFHHIEFTTGCVCGPRIGHFDPASTASGANNNGFGVLSFSFISFSLL